MLIAAEKEQLTYRGFLAELLLAECDDRDRRRSARRVKAAGFPREKWLGDFDFEANPNVNAATIHTLSSCAWVRSGHPLCLIGDSGAGKLHLLIGLATAAAEAGFRVKYALATKPAIVDRLTFGGHIIETGTQSYRLAHTGEPQQLSTCTNPDRPARWVLVVRGFAADLVLGMKQCLGQQGTDVAPA